MAIGLSIIIPCYNESLNLRSTLVKLEEHCRDWSSWELVVVDDGSSDGTSRVAEEIGAELRLPIKVIRHEKNRGKGAAVKTGMLAAKGSFRLFCDADLAVPIHESGRLLKAMHQHVDVAIGTIAKQQDDSRVERKWIRKIAAWAFNTLVRVLLLPDVGDSQRGFKCIRATQVEKVFSRMRMEGFSFDVEMLVVCRALGLTVVQVPVSYSDMNDSRVHVVRDGLRMGRDVISIAINKWRGVYGWKAD